MKKKKRWKKILIWTASIVVVLGISGLFAANYAMDRLIASLANSLESELLEEVTAEVPGTDNIGTDTGTDTDTDTETPATASPEGTKPEEETDTKEQPTTTPSTGDGYTAEISTDKAKDVQEKITVGEKAQLATVLLKELSADDIKALQELASGGLSQEEKKKARTLILERLSPEQYDELIQIAKKYGLSQGKSYEEVSMEK